MSLANGTTPCTLAELVAVVWPVTLKVEVAPRGLEVLVGGSVVEDVNDHLSEHAGGLLLLVGMTPEVDLAAPSLRRAAECGYTGVVLKRHGRDISELAAVAESLNLAILLAPDDAPWQHVDAAISTAVASCTGRDRPSAGSAGDELFSVANAVAAAVGGAVAIEDLGQVLLAYSNLPDQRTDPLRQRGILDRQVPRWPGNTEDYREVFVADGVVRQPGRGDELARAAVAIRAGTLLLGTLWVIEPEGGLTPEHQRALEEAAQLSALHILRTQSATEIEQHIRGDALRAMLEGSDREDMAALRLGLTVGARLTLLALGPSTPTVRSIPLTAHVAAETARRCAALDPDAIVTTSRRVVYVLTSNNPAPAAERLARGLLANLDRAVGGAIFIGIASAEAFSTSFTQLRAQADETLHAVTMRPSSDRVATIDHARSDILLAHVSDELQRHPHLREPVVEALARLDEQQSTDLSQSLLTWLDAQGDVRVAAQALHVHPNTLRYRLRRIRELTGMDTDDPRQRLSVWLQLRATRLTS